jgi:DNA-binding GntR family transcriptional regulator
MRLPSWSAKCFLSIIAYHEQVSSDTHASSPRQGSAYEPSASTDGPALARTGLREQIKEVILDRILSGYYEPGERVAETRIAQELGTSQAPVREALRELETLRFVESQPYRGARVRQVPLEEILEMYPIRSALEEVAAREAAPRLGGDVSGLEAELDAMRGAVAAGDLPAQVTHDVAFHRLIVQSSGNRSLAEVWESLGVQTRTAITFLKAEITTSEVVAVHVPILEALRDRDPELAATRIHEHFSFFCDVLSRQTQKTG